MLDFFTAENLAGLFTPENLVALLTLTALEIVLGIDNIVFIVILTGRLDPAVQAKARRWGLFGAMFTRIALLLALGWIMGLTKPLFAFAGLEFAGRHLILLGGGVFLIGKSTLEIHEKIECKEAHASGKAAASFASAITQIMLLDVIFSLDSVITAVGMANRIPVMIAAVVLAVIVMMVFSGAVSRFIEKRPTLKMLALAFLLLIGVMLTAEGLGKHIEKGYIYFAMGFSLFVEVLNIKTHRGAAADAAPRAATPAA
jgi:predicted tellurium resistance membrane protein TerC